MPHAHCPLCAHLVTQAGTYWTVGPGPRVQHVTCPACAAKLMRPAQESNVREPWVEELPPGD